MTTSAHLGRSTEEWQITFREVKTSSAWREPAGPLLARTGEWQRRPARLKAMCVIEKVYQKANRRLGWSCLLAFIACSTGKFAAQTQTVPPALAELKLQLERGEFEPASRNAGSILAAPQADLDTLLQAGQLLSQYRRYDLAREAFMRAREIDPGSFAAAFNLGYIAFQQGKWQE